jgi:murein DD-endopeptidase MepM/ murein hydrolase activator NlpD
VYELLLRNFEGQPLALQQLRVMDADVDGAPPLAAYGAAELLKIMQPIGLRTKNQDEVTTLPPGGSAIVYLFVTIDAGATTPRHLRHEITTSAGSLSTAAISTNHDQLQVLYPPLEGSNWLAETGLSNDNGHRRGYVVLNGRPVTSRRYAFDWVKVENGELYKGDKQDNASYFGYGSHVLAVADGLVVGTGDGVPQNVPGRTPAVTMTLRNIPGNSITLDIGKNQYAHYMHLQPGSLRVKVGERVRHGQVLGIVGNAGSSFLPHLHFEVTNSPRLLDGQGIPYVFRSFRVVSGAEPVQHRNELPLEKKVIDFGG